MQNREELPGNDRKHTAAAYALDPMSLNRKALGLQYSGPRARQWKLHTGIGSQTYTPTTHLKASPTGIGNQTYTPTTHLKTSRLVPPA